MQQPLVYLIDDDEDDRDIFSLAIKEALPGIVCITAKNGHEALESLNDAKIPDYIFIDLNMPGMSGRECLQEIRRRPMLQNVTTVIYTTSSRPKDAEELQQMGATNYFVKPNSLSKLIATLKNILSGSTLPYFINVSA